MYKPIEVRNLKLRPNLARRYCEECGDEATKEALFDLEQFVAVRKFCDKCVGKASTDLVIA